MVEIKNISSYDEFLNALDKLQETEKLEPDTCYTMRKPFAFMSGQMYIKMKEVGKELYEEEKKFWYGEIE